MAPAGMWKAIIGIAMAALFIGGVVALCVISAEQAEPNRSAPGPSTMHYDHTLLSPIVGDKRKSPAAIAIAKANGEDASSEGEGHHQQDRSRQASHASKLPTAAHRTGCQLDHCGCRTTLSFTLDSILTCASSPGEMLYELFQNECDSNKPYLCAATAVPLNVTCEPATESGEHPCPVYKQQIASQGFPCPTEGGMLCTCYGKKESPAVCKNGGFANFLNDVGKDSPIFWGRRRRMDMREAPHRTKVPLEITTLDTGIRYTHQKQIIANPETTTSWGGRLIGYMHDSPESNGRRRQYTAKQLWAPNPPKQIYVDQRPSNTDAVPVCQWELCGCTLRTAFDKTFSVDLGYALAADTTHANTTFGTGTIPSCGRHTSQQIWETIYPATVSQIKWNEPAGVAPTCQELLSQFPNAICDCGGTNYPPCKPYYNGTGVGYANFLNSIMYKEAPLIAHPELTTSTGGHTVGYLTDTFQFSHIDAGQISKREIYIVYRNVSPHGNSWQWGVSVGSMPLTRTEPRTNGMSIFEVQGDTAFIGPRGVIATSGDHFVSGISRQQGTMLDQFQGFVTPVDDQNKHVSTSRTDSEIEAFVKSWERRRVKSWVQKHPGYRLKGPNALTFVADLFEFMTGSSLDMGMFQEGGIPSSKGGWVHAPITSSTFGRSTLEQGLG